MVSETENELVYGFVLDCDACRFGLLTEDVATTLIAVASEEPADWCEMLDYWPRYTSRVVPEFLSSIPLEIVAREDLRESIGNSQLWIVLDREQKRFLSGEAFQPIGRDACFAMHTDENGDQQDPLSIHLPPWWELAEQVRFEAIDKPRQISLKLPVVDREFLFGCPLVQAIADQVLNVASAGHLKEAIENSEPEARNPFYALTIEVHRDWLMRPRDDLGGLYPRQMLHGGVDWIDALAWGQRLRFEQGGRQIVAAPKDSFGYQHGPLGREELAIYFDLCRELIEASWDWCQDTFLTLIETADGSGQVLGLEKVPTDDFSVGLSLCEALSSFLNEVKLKWLTSPFEGGSAPAFILECSRRRVPRGAGVEIVGMDERQAEQHVIDCDCPICNMMAEGKMGVGFCRIDGHHLELDNEFAFSMCETREAWEDEQREYAEFSAKLDRELKQQVEEGETNDNFASAWSGNVTEEPIPGDTGGNLKLAFLLAEVITEMKRKSAREDLTSDDLQSDRLVEQLNADFSKFQNSRRTDLAANTESLTNTLERIAEAHPSLISRIADFQSRIVESARRPISAPESFKDERWDGDDMPF